MMKKTKQIKFRLTPEKAQDLNRYLEDSNMTTQKLFEEYVEFVLRTNKNIRDEW